MIKIAITGPEASGKSELSKKLAAHFQTSFAPEFAREFLEKSNGAYNFDDLDQIARGQIANEEDALKKASQVCFFDTDMLVLHVWSSFRFGKVSHLIKNVLQERLYDFWLLCKPDLPWEADPLRESPDQKERDELFEIYRDYLERNYPGRFAVIEGYGNERFQKAVKVVEEKL